MTDRLQRQSLILALASIACVGIALWALWHYDVFSTTEDVNIVVQPSLVRWVVAIVVGLVAPQFIVAGAKALGVDRIWCRLAVFIRNVETMPHKVDDIHTTLCGPNPCRPVKEDP
jgi:uncharacterized membrane protein YwzB